VREFADNTQHVEKICDPTASDMVNRANPLGISC